MPWKASSVMEERLRFVARLLDGEPMTEMCREFGISRKTGYKIVDRYQEHGLAALYRKKQTFRIFDVLTNIEIEHRASFPLKMNPAFLRQMR